MERNELRRSTQQSSVSIGKNGIEINDVASLKAFSQLMLDAGFAVGHKDARTVMGAIAWGWQAGLQPITSLQYIAMINGRPAIWGKGLRALVLASGKLEWAKEWTEGDGQNLTAYCSLKRKGMAEPFTASFSIADADKAGLLGKGTWKNYPKRMLEWRAFGFAVANGFADVTCGLMLAEEAQDIEEPPRTISVEVADDDDGDELPEVECVTTETQAEPEPEPKTKEEDEPESIADYFESAENEEINETEIKRDLVKKWASLALQLSEQDREDILERIGVKVLDMRASLDSLHAGIEMASDALGVKS